MARNPKRNPELQRLYVAVGLVVVIWIIFKVYKLLSAQVEVGLDAPSRWALLALGLTNVLVIGTLLFIVARSLAKLYFERRSGILGARIRTKLVLALLAVGIAPSLMLFIIGRNFISKNVDRWFRPETQEIIRDGHDLAQSYRQQVLARLQSDAARVARLRPGEVIPKDGLDLLVVEGPAFRVEAGPGLNPPPLHAPVPDGQEIQTADGRWMLRRAGEGRAVGVFLSREMEERLARLDKHYRESFQIHAFRENLETLPQSTFLFLTLLFIFAAVWMGLKLSRIVSEPVRALAKAAQRVGTGDLEVALPEEGEDELAFLSKTFNSMTRDLSASRSAIVAQAERLEGQRAYQNQLLEALPVGILSWQRDGRVRTCNPAARRWLGLESFDAERDAWEELALQPRMGGLGALLQRVLETRRPHQEELRIGGEGEGRPVRAMVLPLTGGGALAVLEDLSLLAQAEKRAAWQEVARRMAHEVKNPLTPIKLTAQRLLRRVREDRLEPRVVAEGAETILGEVESLSKLVDNFSRFAKLPMPQPRPLDACELLRQVEGLYAPTHSGVHWRFTLPDAPVNVRWDADMMKRALINLVDNALAATAGEGSIRVELSRRGDWIRIAVEDDGSGVPENSRDRLFEPYFSTKRKGTGLGLAIVRKIAQDHGGDALYEPLPGGSRFSLELPGGEARSLL